MKLSLLNIDCHRNGISGHPFHALVFRDTQDPTSVKVGIVFPEPRSCAVLDIAKLADCDVEFGSNSFRGDVYEPHLRKLIAEHEQLTKRRYRVTVIQKMLETYEVEAMSELDARESYWSGHLVDSDDEAVDVEIKSVEAL